MLISLRKWMTSFFRNVTSFIFGNNSSREIVMVISHVSSKYVGSSNKNKLAHIPLFVAKSFWFSWHKNKASCLTLIDTFCWIMAIPKNGSTFFCIFLKGLHCSILLCLNQAFLPSQEGHWGTITLFASIFNCWVEHMWAWEGV